jgi:hypothetical protein
VRAPRLPISKETITDGRRFGRLDKLDNLYRAVLFRILAVLDVRVTQILPTFRVVINLPMSFRNKTVRVRIRFVASQEGFLDWL